MSVARRLPATAVACLASAVGSLLAMAQAYRLWRAELGVPFSYTGDSLPHAMHIKQVIDRGWYWDDPRLAAPFAQHFRDWPLPDILHLFVARFLALFSDNWAAVMNVMFILTFPLAAITACWVLCRFGVPRVLAAVLGVLYAVLPYHMVRGVDHLFLSGYYMVPLGAWLAMSILEGADLFPRESKLRSARTVVFCVLIAMSSAYYATFTILFVAAAAVARFLVVRKVRDVVVAGVVAVLLVATVAVDTIPTILYHRENGPNLLAAKRDPQESDLYGLKLAHMLMPGPGHRIDAFEDFRNRYFAQFPLPGEGGGAALGVVGSVGLLYLLGLSVVNLVTRRRDDDNDDDHSDNRDDDDRVGVAEVAEVAEARNVARRRHLALLAVTGLVVATIGGLTTFIVMLVSTQIRGWNRISIFLGFFALAAVGLVLDAVIRRGPPRRHSALLASAAALVLLVGVADQTSAYWVPPYDALEAEFLPDQAYFAEIERRLPPGAKVYQLPRLQFPEANAVGDLEPYELLRPYLHTERVRWSFGGIKGRLGSQWQDRLAAPGSEAFVFDIVAAGFDAVYIDREAFTAGGGEVEARLAAVLGVAPFTSHDNRKALYDLRPYAERLRAAEGGRLARRKAELLHPVFVEPNDTFYGDEVHEGRHHWWAQGEDARLVLFDQTAEDERSRVRFDLRTATERQATFRITWPDGTTQTIVAGPSPVTVTRELVTERGRTSVTIDSDAARLSPAVDPRALHFQLIDPVALPA